MNVLDAKLLEEEDDTFDDDGDEYELDDWLIFYFLHYMILYLNKNSIQTHAWEVTV